MPNPIVIDLAKDGDAFVFSKNQDARLAMLPKGKTGKGTRSLFQDDGFLILPTPKVAKATAKKSLQTSKSRREVLNTVLREKPVGGLTAALDLKNQARQDMHKVKIQGESTKEEEDLFEYTTITISFHEDQPISEENSLKGLKVFDGSKTALSTKSIAPAAIPKSGEVESFDTITEVFYEDENGNVILSEFLIPETQDDLHNDGIYLKFKGLSADNPELTMVRPKGRFFKRIILKIKKFVGVIKKALLKLKGATANAIAKGLEKIPRVRKKVNSRYEILKYNRATKVFDSLDRDDIVSEIDLSLKTLILLHGSVKGSFDGRKKNKAKSRGKGSYKYLYAGDNTEIDGHPHWFDYLDQVQKNHAVKYEQIITLEHETVLHDPKTNVKRFKELLHLDALQFEQPVAFITASRGSLLAKYMSQPSSNIPFEVERTVIVSGGYSLYFNEKGGARNFIVTLTQMFGLNGPIKFILSLSLDIITKLPGLDVQNRERARFKNIIAESTGVTYFNLVNNYIGTSVKLNTLERIVADPILGPENDLALSLEAQLDDRPGRTHPLFPPMFGNNVHGKGLRFLEYRREMAVFLGVDLAVVS